MGQMVDAEEHDENKTMTLKEVYFFAVVVAPQSIPQFKFYEDISVQSGTDRYVLLSGDKQAAIFKVTGTLTYLKVTPAGAVQHRKPGSKVDEYSARLRIDEEEDRQTIEKGFQDLIALLKDTEKACENIAVLSGLVEKRKSFKLDDVMAKLSYYSNNVFYFNRKVASKDDVPIDDGLTPHFLLNFPPQGKDYPSLNYLTGWKLNPLIPVTDTEALKLKPELVDLPRRATVYFEVRQGCYNFIGKDGPVKQVVLVPWVIAIKAYPPATEEMGDVQKAKRLRLSC